MEESMVTSIITSIPQSALPLVVVIIAGIYFYFKFKGMEDDRQATKAARDNDSQELHDNVLKLQFKVSNLEGIVDLHRSKLESIDQQLGIINQELAKLNTQVDHLVKALEQQNQIMLKHMETK